MSSDQEKQNEEKDLEKHVEPIEDGTYPNPQTPNNKIQRVFQELEIMALQKGSNRGLDISKLNEGQINKLLDNLSQNESNAFVYHTKRLDAIREIELAKLSASTVNQRTVRYILVAILIFIAIITGIILIWKETFFIPWLTFLTGLLGGVGLNKVTSSLTKQPQTKNPIKEDDNKDDES